jgi:hypothetical protein
MAMNWAYVACVLAGLLASAGCDSPESDEKARAIVALSKSAMGGQAWDKIEIWHEIGAGTTASGRPIQYEHWGDFRSLAVHNKNDGVDVMVYDGERAAFACSNAKCDPPAPLDAVAIRGGSYLASFGFFFPERFAASYHYLGERSAGKATLDVVLVAPVALPSLELWIDRSTHRIARMIADNGRSQTDLSDYRRVGGALIPFMSVGDGATIRTQTVQFEPAGSVSFSRPHPN